MYFFFPVICFNNRSTLRKKYWFKKYHLPLKISVSQRESEWDPSDVAAKPMWVTFAPADSTFENEVPSCSAQRDSQSLQTLSDPEGNLLGSWLSRRPGGQPAAHSPFRAFASASAQGSMHAPQRCSIPSPGSSVPRYPGQFPSKFPGPCYPQHTQLAAAFQFIKPGGMN